MHKILNKRLKILGVSVPAMLLLALGATTGFAALLTAFGVFSTQLNVAQAVVLTPQPATFSTDLAGSESYATPGMTITSNTVNDLNISVSQSCVLNSNSYDCSGILSTNLLNLHVRYFDSANPADDGGFALPVYRKIYYVPSGTLNDIQNISYKFEIADRTSGFSNTLFPYVVLVTDTGLIAVEYIPTGATFDI